MSSATDTITAQIRPRAISLRWIISAREDLVWFIGSVASSYALLILYVTGTVPLLPMVAAWAILIDAPHVFGTFSRTYFDRSEWHSRKRLLLGSLLFFVIGPIAVISGLGLVFFFIAALWAYYHLVKQHYGFMVLYKKKNGVLAPLDNALDRLLLMFAFNYPFVAFIVKDAEAMARVPAALHHGLSVLATLLLAGTIVLGVAWAARQIQRAVLGLPLNVPKYLLLAAAIPMHWIVLLTPMPHKPIAIVAILTIYHNFQYHRLIWFHNKKYASNPSPQAERGWGEIATSVNPTLTLPARGEGTARDEAQVEVRNRYGPAALISRRLLYYIAFGIFFGLLYQGPRQFLGYLSLNSGS